MTGPLFEQVSAFRLADALAAFDGDTLLVQVDTADTPLKPEYAAMSAAHQRCRTTQVREEPFWKEIRNFYQRAPELTRVSLEELGMSA